jgi:signal transduction histidine kinase
MAANLEDAERQRRNLVADVAHELRTPVSNIQGYLEALKDGLLIPDEGTIDTIHGQVIHLGHLVEDLRLLAQVEAGALQLHRIPARMPDVLRVCVEAVKPRAEAKGISVSLEAGDDMPLVEMDGTRISQVVNNLLENAIIHTPEGGSVVVSAGSSSDGMVRVTVADTGRGIPSEDLSKVFDRFFRTDPSRNRATGGVGLGLTIAKQLMEVHGGTIHVENIVPYGARFVFELPLAAKDSPASQE